MTTQVQSNNTYFDKEEIIVCRPSKLFTWFVNCMCICCLYLSQYDMYLGTDVIRSTYCDQIGTKYFRLQNTGWSTEIVTLYYCCKCDNFGGPPCMLFFSSTNGYNHRRKYHLYSLLLCDIENDAIELMHCIQIKKLCLFINLIKTFVAKL